MDTFQFLVSVFLILLKCEEFTMQNVTFSNGKKSWKDAVHHCSVRGGVLESNITLLREQDEFKNVIENDQQMWIGKFKTLTNWTYIRGCYVINGNFQHFDLEPSKTMELQCQMLCDKYKFYSIKGADCYCIANISLFVRSKNCNCVGCYKVWEHQLPVFGSDDGISKCIATTSCDGENFRRDYKRCGQIDNILQVICDNDADLGYIYENYQDAADHCERQGSFIKWHSICNSTDLPGYWTSGTRHDETFVIRKAYFTENLQPKNCFILKKNGGEEKKNCDDDFRFFCRFETDEDKGDIISIPNLSMSPKTTVQSDNSRGIIIGIVVSIIVVILIIVGTLVFMIRRIRSRNLLSLSTIVKDEPSTRRTDSSTVTAAYEELNKTDKDKSTHCQSYDQLQSVNIADTAIKTNTKNSIEEESKYETIEKPSEKYSNALTAEYEQLKQTEIVKTTNVYDPLHYTRVKDDPTNARSNNSVSREEHRTYETSQTENETDTNGVPLEYEQLDITKTDTSTKAYDQLHVTHTANKMIN
ncbi:uncharacterized protein LOC143054267 [Mytilus galloprovincialis]|uniref:uncharacterized protein LOC143054267 n=1 Tax=Mytilus galloprovincialis TaxID=29158 RepID=UPI003F7C9EA4